MGSFFYWDMPCCIFRKEREMEAIQAIVDFASLCVEALGIASAIYGIICFSEGHSQQTAIKKVEGLGYIVGGAVIWGAGYKLVPLILPALNL